MIFRSSFETTFSVGTRSRSESESAKLSPIQLNSGLSDVFSNGSTSTVSVPCACAATAKIAVVKNRYKYFLNICLFFVLSVPFLVSFVFRSSFSTQRTQRIHKVHERKILIVP